MSAGGTSDFKQYCSKHAVSDLIDELIRETGVFPDQAQFSTWLEESFDHPHFSKELGQLVRDFIEIIFFLFQLFMFQVKKRKADLRGNMTGRLLMALLKHYRLGANGKCDEGVSTSCSNANMLWLLNLFCFQPIKISKKGNFSGAVEMKCKALLAGNSYRMLPGASQADPYSNPRFGSLVMEVPTM